MSIDRSPLALAALGVLVTLGACPGLGEETSSGPDYPRNGGVAPYVEEATVSDPGLDPSHPAHRTSAGPRPLPTIAKIDWRRFPSEERGGFGRSGTTIRVRPGRFGAVASALASASPGDTIVLAAGTYREGEEGEDAGLRIQKDGIVIRTERGARARFLPRSRAVKRGILIEASNVLVRGLDVEGFDLGIGLGKAQGTVSNIILSEVRVLHRPGEAWTDGIIAWPDKRGARGEPVVDGLLIRNVEVLGVALGISCNGGPCRNWWLENVRVRSASGSGSGADAIAVEEGENIVVVGADVSGATADGIDLKASNVVVMNSRVHHIARNGVKLWDGGDIINTLVHHTGADASYVFEKGRYRVLNSVMAFHNYKGSESYNLTAGYEVQEPIEVDLVNSIFYKTSGGMYFAPQTALRVSHCLFFGMENHRVLEANSRGRRVTVATSGTVRTLERAGFGTGNLYADPLFVDPVRGDFRLGEGSPAVDSGVRSAPFPDTDLLGEARVKSGGPDLGPIEIF
jgi:hypothetical protein